MKSLQQYEGSKKELTWKKYFVTATKSLKKVLVDATVYTNVNLEGWGTVCGKSETGSI